RGGMGGMGI
ncbi:toxR-activated gene, partial [Helicobacter pylori]